MVPSLYIEEFRMQNLLWVRGAYILGPVIDGLTIPQSPEEIIETGAMNQVPVLLGTNKEEAKSFGFAKPDPSNSKEDILYRIR